MKWKCPRCGGTLLADWGVLLCVCCSRRWVPAPKGLVAADYALTAAERVRALAEALEDLQ